MKSGELFRVQGLGGAKTLSGSVAVSGSKNEALPALASAVLFGGPVTFRNIPRITDIRQLNSLLSDLGARVMMDDGGTITVDTSKLASAHVNESTARKFRASVILTGPLLSRMGEVRFAPPGGCLIGKRPIDVFLAGYEAMGATVRTDGEEFVITAPRGGLKGCDVIFRLPSVTATETLMMAAVLAHGIVRLVNVAMEPEIGALADFLNESGADIRGIGTPVLTIRGTDGTLLVSKKEHTAIPDRLEAGSFMILGALCADTLTVTDCDPEHLKVPIASLCACGVPVVVGKKRIVISGNGGIPNRSFAAANIRTHEYPGFPTDLQAPMTVLLSQVSGESIVEEMIFESRLGYAADLVRMGADIDVVHPHKAIVHGPSKLRGRELYSPDLRAGLAYIIAAIVAKGESVIHNIYHIDRGYERVEEKLKSIGVDIERVRG
ncbi:UDP-N-acetylglucosamine 1-carboxyvinyltransferase [Candidatus Wolfebacteria bacterium]|nr:UDP-N-acetylglucosamine 1-carboxyvinyltransferase [Candidatus Wolfebacteria bacterium]